MNSLHFNASSVLQTKYIQLCQFFASQRSLGYALAQENSQSKSLLLLSKNSEVLK